MTEESTVTNPVSEFVDGFSATEWLIWGHFFILANGIALFGAYPVVRGIVIEGTITGVKHAALMIGIATLLVALGTGICRQKAE